MAKRTNVGTVTKVSDATRDRASNKLVYQTKFIKRLLASIQEFYADASEDARDEAKADLQEVSRELTEFLAE
jgi:hypothetical protein